MVIKRGDIFYADLRPVVGSEQGGIRPVLIIQNNVGNRHSPTVICAAITSKMNKAKLPTHIEIDAGTYGIEKDSVILLEQLRTIDKKRLKDKVCHLDEAMLDKVNHALEISLELTFESLSEKYVLYSLVVSREMFFVNEGHLQNLPLAASYGCLATENLRHTVCD